MAKRLTKGRIKRKTLRRKTLRRIKSFRKSLRRKSLMKKRKYKGGGADCVKHKGTTTSVSPHVTGIDYRGATGRSETTTFYTLEVVFPEINNTILRYRTTKSYREIIGIIKDYTTYSCNLPLRNMSMGRNTEKYITRQIVMMGEEMKTIMSGTGIWVANETNCKNRAEKINAVIKLLLKTVLMVTGKDHVRIAEDKLVVIRDIMSYGRPDFWTLAPN
jgi:hypothetical protein